MPENYLLVGLIERYSGILLSEGNLQADGIDMVLKLENLEDQRYELTDKIMFYVNYAKQVQRSKK